MPKSRISKFKKDIAVVSGDLETYVVENTIGHGDVRNLKISSTPFD